MFQLTQKTPSRQKQQQKQTNSDAQTRQFQHTPSWLFYRVGQRGMGPRGQNSYYNNNGDLCCAQTVETCDSTRRFTTSNHSPMKLINTCTCTHTNTHAHAHTHTHTHTHTHIHTPHMHARMYVYLCAPTHTHTGACSKKFVLRKICQRNKSRRL